MTRFSFLFALWIVAAALPVGAQSQKYRAYFELYSVDANAIATVAADGTEKPIVVGDASSPLYGQTSGSIRVGDTLVALGKTPDVTDPGWALSRETFTPGERTISLGESGSRRGLPSRVQVMGLPAAPIAAGKNARVEITRELDDPRLKILPSEGGTTNDAEPWIGSRIELQMAEKANGAITYDISMILRTLREQEPVPVIETFVQTATVTSHVDDLTAFVTKVNEPGRVLLVLLRVRDENHPRPPQFNVENKFIQIQGKPDWSWWTQAYPGAFEYKDGAGRVFGPIDATGFWKEIDFARVGFPNVPQNDPVIISSPRISWVLDHRELSKRGAAGGTMLKLLWMRNTPDTSEKSNNREFVRISDHMEPLYKSLSQRPNPTETVWEPSKAMIVMTDIGYTEEGKPIIPSPGQGDGLLMTVEARSTDRPGVYSVDQNIIVHKKKMNISRGDWKWGDELVQGQFECDYEVRDGSTTAFLLPIKNDEFLLMLSTFTLLPQEQMSRRPYDVDIKAVLVDGTPDWEAINTLDVPDALEHRDGSPIIFWPKNPYGFWNLDDMESIPQRFYFKNITATRHVWDSRAGEAKGTNGFPVGDSFLASYTNALSPAGYQVPFTAEALAKNKHIVGVRMASSITDTQPADPRPRGILAAYEALEAEESWRVPRRLDEFIQLQLPVDVAETDQRAGEDLFYARSDVSYKPHDNLLTVRLFPVGGSKYFLILSRFTMNNGASLSAKGWYEKTAAH